MPEMNGSSGMDERSEQKRDCRRIVEDAELTGDVRTATRCNLQSRMVPKPKIHARAITDVVASPNQERSNADDRDPQ